MDLLNPKTKYELLTNNVPRVNCATGGLLQSSSVVCGGANLYSKDCIVIGQPKMFMKMLEKRTEAASVVLKGEYKYDIFCEKLDKKF